MAKREREPLVVITRSGNDLLVDFMDDDEEPDRLKITEHLDALEYKSILLSNGKAPRGKTCRALLKCNCGSLVFDNKKYGIQVAATRELSGDDSGRVGQNNVPTAHIELDLPESPEWRDFEKTGELEPIFKRYIRYAIFMAGRLDRSVVKSVNITLLDETTGPTHLQMPPGESFSSFVGLGEGNTGEQAVLVKIEHAGQELDGVYFVKGTTNRSLWSKELFVGRLLQERTGHPSFLGAQFGFRYRKEARNDAQEYYAIAIPFQPSWSVRRLMKLPQQNLDDLREAGFTATQLMQSLHSLVDALLSAHPDRVRGDNAIDFRHCDLHPGNVLIGREKIDPNGHFPCWLIDFSHSDIFYSEVNNDTGEFERQHLVGSTPRRDQELNFVATSASKNEVGALVRMWTQLLRRFHYEEEAKFLETWVGEMSTRTNAIAQLDSWLQDHRV